MAEELTNRQIAQRERRERERREKEAAQKGSPANLVEQGVDPETLDPIASIQDGTATPLPTENLQEPLGASIEGEGTPTPPNQEMLSEEAPRAPSVDVSDDSSSFLYRTFQDREIQRLNEEISRSIPKGQPTGKVREAESQEPITDPGDPLGIRLLTRSSPLLPQNKFNTQVLGGVRDAVQNTLTALDDFAEWANENLIDLGKAGTGVKVFEELPEVEAAEGPAEGLVRGVSQFLTGFIPAMRGVKALQAGRSAGIGVGFVQTELVAGGTGALVFDPLEENLSNLIQEYSPLEIPLLDYLAKDEDDTAAVGRLKDAIEGMAVGAAGEGVFRGIKALKEYRREIGLPTSPIDEYADPNTYSALGNLEAEKLEVERTPPPDFVPSPEAQFTNRTIDDFSEEEIDESYRLLGNWIADEDHLGNKVTNQPHDPLLREFAHTQTLDEDMVVFRGGNIRDGERLISTSKKLSTALSFMGLARQSVADISEIRVPAGAAGIDVVRVVEGAQKEGWSFEEAVTGIARQEEEVILPLGGDWELKYVGDRAPGEGEEWLFRFDELQAGLKIKQYEIVPSEQARIRDAAIEADKLRIAQSTEPRIDEELVNKWLSGDIPVTSLPFKINWAKIAGPEDVAEVVGDISRMFSEEMDVARRGRITDEQAKKLAEDLGMTVDDLMARRSGQVFNAEEVIASRLILEASASKLIEMGKMFKNSMDEKDMYQLMRMMNIHVGIQRQFQGAASEAGRALRAYQLPTGSPEKQLRDIQEGLMANGGPC